VFCLSVFFQEAESTFRAAVVAAAAAVVVRRRSGRGPGRLVQDVAEEIPTLADFFAAVVDGYLVVVVLHQFFDLVQLRVVVTHHRPGTLGVARRARRRPRAVTPVTTVTPQIVVLSKEVFLLATQRVELLPTL